MRILATVVGIPGPRPSLTWPDGWPVPREGDEVETLTPAPLTVRRVVWYPEGNPDDVEQDREPFVYLVIGPARP